MTTLVMNYTVNPFWTAIKAFARGTWALMESIGRARAAAELHRQGYHEAAKNVMLGN